MTGSDIFIVLIDLLGTPFVSLSTDRSGVLNIKFLEVRTGAGLDTGVTGVGVVNMD
jgi:hypothetical protein